MSLLIRRQRGTCRWLQGGLSEAQFQDQQGEHGGYGGESHLVLHGFSSPLGGGSREVWGHRSGWCRPWGLWEVCTVVTHASDGSGFQEPASVVWAFAASLLDPHSRKVAWWLQLWTWGRGLREEARVQASVWMPLLLAPCSPSGGRAVSPGPIIIFAEAR